MKSIILFSLLFASIYAQSQYALAPRQAKVFNNFIKTTTCAVLLGDKEYDNKLKQGMQKYWKITEFEFVSYDQFEDMIEDESKSFILPLSYSIQSGSSYATCSIIGVINGGKSKIGKYRTEDLIGLGLIDNSSAPGIEGGREVEIKDFAYRVDHIIGYIADAVNLVDERNLTTAIPKALIPKLFSIYNKRSNNIKNKTLLIEKSIFDNDIEASNFRKEYKFKYKVVKKEEIVEAFNNYDKRYMVLLTFKAPSINFFVASCEDAKIYYGDMLSVGLLDYKKISSKKTKKMTKFILKAK